MEAWVLAALAGICPVGWPRFPIDSDRLLWLLKHFPPIPPPPRPDEGPHPEPWKEGPRPEPWKAGPLPDRWASNLARGVISAAAGVAAWAAIGSRFANDGAWAVIGIGFVGGCAGLWIADLAGQLRGARNLEG